MEQTTRIDPPIRFRRLDGSEAAIDLADTLADWLDALYDAILDPDSAGAVVAGGERAEHLREIEHLLLDIEAEIAKGAATVSEALRIGAITLIGHYRQLDLTAGRTAGQLRKPRGPGGPVS